MGSSQASVGAGLRCIAGLRCYIGLQRIQHLDRAPHMVLQKWMWNCGRSSMNNYGTYVEHMWNKYGTYKHIWWTIVIDGICLLFSHNFQINPNQDVSKPRFFFIFFPYFGGLKIHPRPFRCGIPWRPGLDFAALVSGAADLCDWCLDAAMGDRNAVAPKR